MKQKVAEVLLVYRISSMSDRSLYADSSYTIHVIPLLLLFGEYTFLATQLRQDIRSLGFTFCRNIRSFQSLPIKILQRAAGHTSSTSPRATPDCDKSFASESTHALSQPWKEQL